MPKILEFKTRDKTGKEKAVGKMEIKNQTGASAELYFYGDIVGSSWEVWQQEDMCPQNVQDFLSQLEGTENINIYINSGGGDVFAGLAIYNMLKRNPANKTVRVDGLAASIASVIALAGDTVIIPSTAEFMIHNAWAFLWGGYSAKDLTQVANALSKCDQAILNVYAENLKKGVSIDTIKQLMDEETWMTGEEAAEYFNIQVEETASIAAFASSQYFARYRNTPKHLTKPQQRLAPSKISNGVVPKNVSNETAPEDTPWAAPILADFTDKMWMDLTNEEKAAIAGHYAWSNEMPPAMFGDLKLPHHRASDGKVVWEGVANAAARLDTADIPEEDKAYVRAHLGEHYHQFGKTPPWEQDNSEDKSLKNPQNTGKTLQDKQELAKLKAKLALECEL